MTAPHHTHRNHMPVPPITLLHHNLPRKSRLFVKSRFLDTIGHNQTDRTDYAHTICSFIGSTLSSNPIVVRSVPRSIAYTKKDTPHHSREKSFLGQQEISTAVNPTTNRWKWLDGIRPHHLARRRGQLGPSRPRRPPQVFPCQGGGQSPKKLSHRQLCTR